MFFQKTKSYNLQFCKTQAFRQQMMLCYTLLSKKMFSLDFEVGPGYTTLLASIDDFEKVKCGFEGIPLFSESHCSLFAMLD